LSIFEETGDSENQALRDKGGNRESDETGNEGNGNTGKDESAEFLGGGKKDQR